jgi:hypothetical protein
MDNRMALVDNGGALKVAELPLAEPEPVLALLEIADKQCQVALLLFVVALLFSLPQQLSLLSSLAVVREKHHYY